MLWNLLDIKNTLYSWQIRNEGVKCTFISQILSPPLRKKNKRKIEDLLLCIFCTHGLHGLIQKQLDQSYFSYLFNDGVASLFTAWPRTFEQLKPAE